MHILLQKKKILVIGSDDESSLFKKPLRSFRKEGVKSMQRPAKCSLSWQDIGIAPEKFTHPPRPVIPQLEGASESSEGLVKTGCWATTPEFLSRKVRVGGLGNHPSTSQVLLMLLVSESHLHNTDPSLGCSVDVAEGQVLPGHLPFRLNAQDPQ